MRGKADSDLVRRQNRRVVLEALRAQGPMARVDLGRVTGLSPASITTITVQLISDQAILELDEPASSGNVAKRGRPSVRLGLNPHATRVLVIKISVDGVEFALADFDSKIGSRKLVQVATYDIDPEIFGARLVAETRLFISENNLSPPDIARIGVAAQGVADTRDGSIAWSPAFKARGMAVVAPLQKAFSIPCSIANDANMIAEGHLARNPAEKRGTTAVVFMGYGVGMGLIFDGAVYHGTSGAAAEFGHMNHMPGGALCRCGRAGCIEAYASDYAILRSAENLPDNIAPPSSAVDRQIMLALEHAARKGDKNSVAAYAKAGRAIGFGLARMIALLNPDRIVLAGPGTSALDLIEPALRAAIDEGVVAELRQTLQIETVPIETDMIIIGTIDAVMRHLDSEIFAYGPMPAFKTA